MPVDRELARFPIGRQQASQEVGGQRALPTAVDRDVAEGADVPGRTFVIELGHEVHDHVEVEVGEAEHRHRTLTRRDTVTLVQIFQVQQLVDRGGQLVALEVAHELQIGEIVELPHEEVDDGMNGGGDQESLPVSEKLKREVKWRST